MRLLSIEATDEPGHYRASVDSGGGVRTVGFAVKPWFGGLADWAVAEPFDGWPDDATMHRVASAVFAFHTMGRPDAVACPMCHRPADTDPFFEGMHRVCFHYAYEHSGDPDVACGHDCPSRALPSGV